MHLNRRGALATTEPRRPQWVCPLTTVRTFSKRATAVPTTGTPVELCGAAIGQPKPQTTNLNSLGTTTRQGNDGADPAHIVLAPDDDGFVDTRGGWGWGDRCWNHLKAGKLGWAKAECRKGMGIANLRANGVTSRVGE